jgi:undecaprenyl-diphosphatase
VGFAFATGVWLRNRRAGTLLYCLAALYAFARVYTGVCYPLDVIGGAAIGAAISYVIYWILRLIEPLPTLVIKVVRLFYLA